MKWLENESLAKHTSLHIGGAARWYCEARTVDEIKQALAEAKERDIKVAILGGGTNSLFSDAGFDGLVLRPMLSKFEAHEDGTVRAEAGVLSVYMAKKTAELGLAGFEWAATLPGTIGGAVRGNAGCFGGETKDRLLYVEVLKGSEVITIDQNRCGFAYRDSIFKSLNDNVILAAAFKLAPANRHECEARVAEIIAKRKATQPQGTASAGCMFKNFEFTHEDEITKLTSVLTIPKDFLARKVIPAGWLIEQAGLKGFTIGGASISEVHGNFLVVTPGAKADHIHQLVASIKSKIRNAYGVQLQEEVQFFV